ncbi:O-antigen ligase family protein, partial [Clostridium baratii]|uniref:O-antigen ligase family protein n=1 Tax=Clostridium baratii TaxID=1561 RepID=UPI00374EBF37
ILVPISINTGFMCNQYDGIAILRIPMVFATLLGITIGLIGFKRSIEKDCLNKLMIIIMLYTFIQVIIAKDFVKYSNFIFLYGSIIMLLSIMKKIEINAQSILDVINVVAIYNGILSIFQYITECKLLPGVWNENIYFSEGANMVKRVVGVVGTNNAAGNFGALLFVIVLYNIIKKRRIIDFIALFCTSIFSILTLTRIGYLAIGVSILIFYFFSNWKKRNGLIVKYFLIIIGIIVVGFIILKFGDKIYNTLFLKRGYTSDYRFTQFEFVIKNLIPDNILLGVGAGQMNRYILYNFGYREIDLHSQYLNVLVEQGVIIFTIFLIFNILIFKKLLKKYKNNSLERILVVCLFISNLICSNYNPNQYYLSNNILYFSVMFIILYSDLIEKDYS